MTLGASSRSAPFGERTWRLLDRHANAVRNRYWKIVVPNPKPFTEAETAELIDRLLGADRPRTAFSAVIVDWGKVETSRLRRLLTTIATVDSEPAHHFQIDSYDLSRALESLGERPGVATDEMARLEFAFIEVLRNGDHGIPHLERSIAESPQLFVQVLAMAFNRNDGGRDPQAWCVDDPARREALASAAYALLDQTKLIPGTNSEGHIATHALMRWVTDVRDLCREHGRIAVGDQQVGQWLSRASSEDDTHWPCRPVCEALEAIASEDMAAGFEIGVFNGRGVTMRGLNEGGGQERGLAARYRARAQTWRFEYPFVGRILDEIADGYERYAAQEDAQVHVRQRLEQ